MNHLKWVKYKIGHFSKTKNRKKKLMNIKIKFRTLRIFCATKTLRNNLDQTMETALSEGEGGLLVYMTLTRKYQGLTLLKEL